MLSQLVQLTEDQLLLLCPFDTVTQNLVELVTRLPTHRAGRPEIFPTTFVTPAVRL